MEYRYMQSDMYNLYPAIGAVNATRQNYNFQMLPGVPSSFGTCEMKIEIGKQSRPPVQEAKLPAPTSKTRRRNFCERSGQPSPQHFGIRQTEIAEEFLSS